MSLNIKSTILSDIPKVEVLEILFNQLFELSENTLLISGGDEPIYLPASETGDLNKIISTRDYFSSALHEVSHWCLAGIERRKQIDYGYWYEPDGRSFSQQQLFEQVEVKPQALEWLFTVAAGQTFRLSVDNVNQPELTASDIFRKNVYLQAISYIESGLPDRAQLFLNAILKQFQPSLTYLDIADFQLDKLN